jgi:hypothetical protein
LSEGRRADRFLLKRDEDLETIADKFDGEFSIEILQGKSGSELCRTLVSYMQLLVK